MTLFHVYLEVDKTGSCMAHVAGLPGCIAIATGADGKDRTLADLPATILRHIRWLKSHGEDLSAPETIELKPHVMQVEPGPFTRGGHAALFEIDQGEINLEEIEKYLRFAGYARADLLNLVHGLPVAVLGWKPGADSMSIREVLRHIGNAEEWYVSRIVDASKLPPEWEKDEAMPVYSFLRMERKTASACLRGLNQEQRSVVVYPTQFTKTPGEPWTARKALRRFLEHETEHTGHIRDILDAWRKRLLARMASERANLIRTIAGLKPESLSGEIVFGEYTVKDLLAHIAAWDGYFAGRIKKMMEGKTSELVGVEADLQNKIFHEKFRSWTLGQVMGNLFSERVRYTQLLENLDHTLLHKTQPFPWGRSTSIRVWSNWRHRHDRIHKKEIQALIKDKALQRTGVSQPVVIAGLRSSREEFTRLVDLIPEEDRCDKKVCGEWTMKDLAGHLADWELFGVETVKRVQAGKPIDDLTAIAGQFQEGFDSWNQSKAEARKDQPWEQVWGDFTDARQELIRCVGKMTGAELEARFVNPWDQTELPMFVWVNIWAEHEGEHTHDLQKFVGIV